MVATAYAPRAARRRQARADAGGPLTDRWTPLRRIQAQVTLWEATSRFRVVPAGRRSGKTELAKRFLVLQAIAFFAHPDGWFICAAPTRQQAKDIFWGDLKRMVPNWALLTGKRSTSINESELKIFLFNGATIQVVGMDQPMRVEGHPIDGAVVDEYGNMKEAAWSEHLRPALSTVGREGWAWLIGVPEGRNHYYKRATHAMADATGEWSYHHWLSREVLNEAEIRSAMRDLDRLTFEQEYEGSFLNFTGRAYYDFERSIHALPQHGLDYDPRADLVFCFDFNRAPGVAVVCQEQDYQGRDGRFADQVTGVIGEVWIPKNSNTVKVCRRLAKDWGDHQGRVLCYGDATGGAKKSSSVDGSDWDLVEQTLRLTFGDALAYRYRKANPAERARVNCVNSRIMTADGTCALAVDPAAAPHTVDDLEGTVLVEGGSGELDKDPDDDLTHLSDALGYYMHEEFHISGPSFVEE